MKKLTITDHSRVFDSNIYIYPVLSRRSQGVSIGINLNINNACNWRCVYCQVEGLVRGKPISVDLTLLELELDAMLNQIINGNFLQLFAPIGMQRFNDIAISGNGEPTLAKEFLSVVKIISKLRIKYGLNNHCDINESAAIVKTVLITNGSEIEDMDVLAGIELLANNHGEVWFKVDRATAIGINQVNQVNLSVDGIRGRLILSAKHCTTYIQTCMFQNINCVKVNQRDKIDAEISPISLPPSSSEIDEYIKFVIGVKSHIAGVLLYSVARNPALPEGVNIVPVSDEFLQQIAQRLLSFGVVTRYYL